MDLMKNKLSGRYKWQIIIIYASLIVLVILAISTSIFKTTATGTIPQTIWFMAALVALVTLIFLLSQITKVSKQLEDNFAKLNEISQAIGKNHLVLEQIDRHSRLSDAARTIAFHETEIDSLRITVFDRLWSKQFKAAYEIIDKIEQSGRYGDWAIELRTEADKYRNALGQEHLNRAIEQIGKLLDSFQWTKASELVEKLIKAEPDSDMAKAMRQKLIDKKDERKKVLLTAWDDAIKRQATDRSLDILRELDLYLTPNEGLALQEAARDVFKNKLHSLGVRFSLAVSGRNWQNALETGRKIIKDFPNSKMAGEIRERLEVLEQKTKQTSQSPQQS